MASSLIVSNDNNALLAFERDAVKKYNNADIFRLTNDAKKSIQVKETTEFLQKSNFASIGEKKLLIVHDMAQMTPQAQNKMLKTIEEAPSTDFLFLATTDATILNTIKSRCKIKYLPRESSKIIIQPETLETLKNIFGVEIDEKTLNAEQKQAILNCQSKIERNIAANCNATNQKDLLLLELLKYAKNGTN
jgi:DNA polymerase III gamma/tau subunit